MGKLANVLLMTLGLILIMSTVLTGFLWFVGMDTTQLECSTRCVRLHTDCGLSSECPLVKECCVDQFGECVAPDTVCEHPVIPDIQRVRSVLFKIIIVCGFASSLTLLLSK